MGAANRPLAGPVPNLVAYHQERASSSPGQVRCILTPCGCRLIARLYSSSLCFVIPPVATSAWRLVQHSGMLARLRWPQSRRAKLRPNRLRTERSVGLARLIPGLSFCACRRVSVGPAHRPLTYLLLGCSFDRLEGKHAGSQSAQWWRRRCYVAKLWRGPLAGVVQDRVGFSTRDDYQVRTAHEHGERYLQRAQVLSCSWCMLSRSRCAPRAGFSLRAHLSPFPPLLRPRKLSAARSAT